jgi:hypothetical protein
MRTLAGAVVLAILAVGRSAAQTPLFDRQLQAAAALQASARAASSQDSTAQVPTLELALPTPTHSQHALGTTLLLVGGGAILVGALAGGGGGTVLIVGGLACAAYGIYLLQL